MLNYSFQIAVMNDTEPSFKDTSAYEKSLRSGAVKMLFYNSQVTDPVTQRMQYIAKDHHVLVVGVTETQPPERKTYVALDGFGIQRRRKGVYRSPLTHALSSTMPVSALAATKFCVL